MSRGIYDKVNKVRIPTCGDKINIDAELSTTSQNAVENRAVTTELNKAFKDSDTAETALANNDYFPFFDTSTGSKKKVSMANLKNSVGADTSKLYSTNDTAETSLADADYFPFYDASASTKKKTLWSNIKSVLSDVFAPKSHASTASTYGLGTTSSYGHVKTINNLTKSSYSNGEALSAYMGYTIDQQIANYMANHYNRFAFTTTNNVTTNYGSIAGVRIILVMIDKQPISASGYIRISGVNSGNSPTVHIRSNEIDITQLKDFNFGFCSLRGSAGSAYASDGGELYHSLGWDDIVMAPWSYIGRTSGTYFVYIC